MEIPIHIHGSNPLLLPEIVWLVMDNVGMAADLLNCACVNKLWNAAAMRKLYTGSLTDMQFRTPDIISLNCLFVSSRDRFVRNINFMKHLLLLPETPSRSDGMAYTSSHRTVCNERLRLLDRRKDAELLFRPQGTGLTSVSIPFEMMSQGWSSLDVVDLLLPSSAEFLAIDYSYCKYLWLYEKENLEKHSGEKFTNLKALTIYKQETRENVRDLCRLLKNCQLRFFHFEEGLQPLRDSKCGYQYLDEYKSRIEKLLPDLREQRDLETLALISPQPHDHRETASIGTHSWPNLKTLYLREEPRNWLEHLPRWENLQVLTLRHIPETHTPLMMESISKCRNLRVLNLQLKSLDSPKKLVDIADACPLLRIFRVQYRLPPGVGNVRYASQDPNTSRDHDVFLDLLQVLPHIEILELSFRFHLNESLLRDIAGSCPCLISLRLRYATLFLSPSAMNLAHPFQHLEFFFVSMVSFERSGEFLSSDEFHTITAEWHRIFPRLRGISCPFECRRQTSTDHPEPELWQSDVRDVETESSGESIDAAGESESENSISDGPISEGRGLESESSDSESEYSGMDDFHHSLIHSPDGLYGLYGWNEKIEGLSFKDIMQTVEGQRGEMMNVPSDGLLSLFPLGGPTVKTLRDFILYNLGENLRYHQHLWYNSQATFGRIWQMNMEVEISGWPVVPSYAFSNPRSYSSSFSEPHVKTAEENLFILQDGTVVNWPRHL